jgi:uncharacterized protein
MDSAHPAGVPCWVAQLSPDANGSRDFYTALFDWTFDNIASANEPPFYVAASHGDRVAGLTGPQDPAVWIGAISVNDLDEACRVAEATGGTAPGESVDIATLGRFHRLHDPAGAEIHVMQPLEDYDVARLDRPGACSLISLSVDDFTSVAPFYEALFGWRAEKSETGVVFRLPGYDGGSGHPTARDVVAVAEQADPREPARWTPDFWVDDADATAEVALARGGHVLTEPLAVGAHLRTAVLADPSGARFTVSQRIAGE